MNVALGAFMLTLLFLPAVSFRLAINRLENLKGLLSTLSITDSIWVFTIIPIMIHLMLIIILRSLNYIIKLDLLLNITYSNARFPLDNRVLGKDLISFSAYNLLAITIGFFWGAFINILERKRKLISRLLGRGNEWYEAFEGNVVEVTEGKINMGKSDFVYLDVLAGTKESSILYSGVLVKYYYKPRSTELDYLVLGLAKKET
jgi:hypothetical protein